MRLMPPEPFVLPKRKKRRRKARVLAAPLRSHRVYIYIQPSKVHLFRYLLEAEDNLGIMTVVDRWRTALMVRCSPHQKDDLLRFLEAARQTLPFEYVTMP